ncbi:MAG: hypothetical protein LBV00_06500, partial [Propionibacteriaceae bacterium]|nr:hypothetical protein [Propionibacteriaceae bacterium]
EAGLVVDPCVPADWDGFTVTRQWRGATYEITVTNPGHVACGVRSVTVDGVETPVVSGDSREHALVPLGEAGKTYKVAVVLG